MTISESCDTAADTGRHVDSTLRAVEHVEEW